MMIHPQYDHDYDPRQRPHSRPSPHSTRRHDPYAYDRWSEKHLEQTHNYAFPTPIHEPEPNNDQGSRRRISMACARCRRRKIKCSGDPKDGTGCNACRTAGTDLNNCVFTRVGTDRQYELIPMPEYIPAIQTAAYAPMDGAGRSFSSHPMSWRDAPTPSYLYDQRTSFPSTLLPQYSLDVVESIAIPVTSSISDESSFGSIWSHSSGRTSTALGGYYDGGPVASYESIYPLQRTTSNTSDQYSPLSPLNLTTMHSTLPPPPERRLPAPNFVGTAMAPDSPDLNTSIRGRLASLSLSGLHDRNVMPWSMEQQSHPGANHRQPSVQGLPASTVILPPVSRGFINPDTVSATVPHDNGAMGYLFSPSSSAPDLPLPSAGAVGPAFYGNAALPPLTAPVLQPITRYPSISVLSTPLPRIIADELPRQPSDSGARYLYTWTTDRKPSTVTAGDENLSLSNSQRHDPLAAVQLHHPRPQVPHQAHSLELLAREAPPPPPILPSSQGQSSKSSQRLQESSKGSKKPKPRGSKGSLH